ncbi:MAG: phosphoribosyl-AMP cyclohydrolase, partial [Dietzia sp.]
EEGIRFAECLSPLAIEVDGFGMASGARFERVEIDENGRRRATGDGDTVLLRVDQTGAACHNGTDSCFDTDTLLGEE